MIRSEDRAFTEIIKWNGSSYIEVYLRRDHTIKNDIELVLLEASLDCLVLIILDDVRLIWDDVLTNSLHDRLHHKRSMG